MNRLEIASILTIFIRPCSNGRSTILYRRRHRPHMSYTPKRGGSKWVERVARLLSEMRKDRDDLNLLASHAQTVPTAQLICTIIVRNAKNTDELHGLLRDYAKEDDDEAA